MKKTFLCLPGLCFTLAGILPASAALDLDHDSLGDVWQQYYNAVGLNASADTDGDGMTNSSESISGTDPHNASSKLDIGVSAGATAAQRVLSWPSVSGKSYFVESSADLAAWAQEGSAQNGTGSTLSATITLPVGGGKNFYRIACHDRDTDSDALSDWEELTSCLDPANPQTVAGTDDVTTLAAAITATGNVLTAVVIDGQAYEADTTNNTPEGGTIRLVRTGGLAALNVVKNIVNGVTIPAGQSGDVDLDNAMDALFNHPNTASFIARRLIQRLVTSNPSRGYVYRVANKFSNDGTGVRGNLGAVVKTILTDYEARTQTQTSQASYGKQREPIIAFLHMLRAMGATSGTGGNFFDTATLTPYGYVVSDVSAGTHLVQIRTGSATNQSLPQAPLNAPSVFNWFTPDYVFPGELQSNGLVTPEFQLTNETNVVTNPNFHYGLIWNLPSGGSNPGPLYENVPGASQQFTRISLSLTAANSALTSGGATGLVNFYDRLFCAHQMSTATKDAIVTALNGIADNTEKVRTALYLTIASPDYIIQR